VFILSNVKKLAKTNRIAAVGKEGEMSFAELEARSESLAAFLLSRYPGRAPIILWGDKEHDMLTGVLAALKTGRPYVMVPNYYPGKRVQLIVDSCQPCAVFNVCTVPFTATGCDLYEREAFNACCRDYAGITVDPALCVQPDDMVCLFYTSGSTGTPKGVVVTRRNIQAMVDWWLPISDLGLGNPRVLNFTPYGFSSSMATIYNSLGMLGATLYAVDKELSSDFSQLMAFITQVDPHYFDSTPSFADICLLDPRFCKDRLPSMRQLTVGGEPCPHRTAERLLDSFPGVQVINAYGATETTIGTTACDITREMITSEKPIPIGYPSFNSKVFIMDEAGRQLPDGEVGELVIVSDMITPGYFNDPERTARYYFTDADGTRGYHTRDLAWIENGLVYYVGRMDNMVKVGGYRVEIEEVERYLSKVSAVAKCAVAPAEEDQRVSMLVAFIVLKPEVKIGIQTTIAIKKEMAQWVQGYMIPQKMVYLDELPYNTNDKIDRHKLRQMAKP
jgi:D-alanine--poly(phosphoribitol) ligase subunit 1